jgi:hypothetical protein
MSYRIRFQRPEARGSISNLFVEDDAATAMQIRHLEAIGYTIIDAAPSPEPELRFPDVQPAFSRPV